MKFSSSFQNINKTISNSNTVTVNEIKKEYNNEIKHPKKKIRNKGTFHSKTLFSFNGAKFKKINSIELFNVDSVAIITSSWTNRKHETWIIEDGKIFTQLLDIDIEYDLKSKVNKLNKKLYEKKFNLYKVAESLNSETKTISLIVENKNDEIIRILAVYDGEINKDNKNKYLLNLLPHLVEITYNAINKNI